MQSSAPTVAKYLSELPPDRRAAIEIVRETILKNLDADVPVTVISYQIPPAHRRVLEDPSEPEGSRCASLRTL